MDINNLSLTMGKRLKDEREKCGLSHEKLRAALLEKYGVEISKDSLINYEVSDENHTKKYKNNGMRVEYLRYFADFYGVSADWLLGLSNLRSKKLDYISASDLGLSEEAICGIMASKCFKIADDTGNVDASMLDGINMVLGQQEFYLLCMDICALALQVSNAIEHEKSSEYDGKPIFHKDLPNATILMGFDACEYTLFHIKEIASTLIENATNYKILKHFVQERRETTLKHYSDKDEKNEN